MMSPLPGLKDHSLARFPHGWRHGPNDDARYAGFRAPPLLLSQRKAHIDPEPGTAELLMNTDD
jgi:hypothetical protein